jgi:hypothetical protein
VTTHGTPSGRAASSNSLDNSEVAATTMVDSNSDHT